MLYVVEDISFVLQNKSYNWEDVGTGLGCIRLVFSLSFYSPLRYISLFTFSPVGIAIASGVATLTTVAHVLSAGDHVIVCDDVYGGTDTIKCNV